MKDARCILQYFFKRRHAAQGFDHTVFLHCTESANIKTDLANAGARWEDKKVIVDAGLVTSRKPADIPAFNKQMLKAFAAGKRSRAAS